MNHWELLGKEKKTAGGKLVLAKCSCGTIKWVYLGNIKQGKSTRCTKCTRIRHGDSRPDANKSMRRLHRRWISMRSRCENKNNFGYKDYGDRGIRVCKEWQSYEAFKEWSLNNGWSPDLTIDRIDVNGNYTPNNCRYVDQKQQSRNTRRNVKIGGVCVEDLAKELGVSRSCVVTRMNKGWTIEQIRSNPKRPKINSLPKYITTKRNAFLVRLGPCGKHRVGTFKTLNEAKRALKKELIKGVD